MTLPTTRFDFLADVPDAGALGRVHFVAIGGAGMSGVARIMLTRGLRVSGSDAKESPLLRSLRAEGAVVHVGHDPALVQGVDTVVISSAIRDSNPELVAARAAGLRVLHRAQALASTMTGARRVAVAGANGKTTTTSLLTVALQACGIDPSFAIGGELARAGTNAHLGTGDVFVVEADESDGSFLVYRPEVAVVTSVQPDHLDFYGDVATVEEAYRAFVATIRPGGLLVACVDDPGARDLAAHARGLGLRVLTYGESEQANLRVSAVIHQGLTAYATLTLSQPALDPGLDHARTLSPALSSALVGRPYALTLAVPGGHNVLNAAAAFGAAVVGLDQPPERVLEGLASFSGTRRRFEPRGQVGGVQVVDDYAHNPGKLSAVVSTGRRLVDDVGSGRLVVVFQPHLYSRTADFAAELGAALAPADVVVVMDVFAAREDPLPGVTGRLVADATVAAATTLTRPPAEVHYEPSWIQVAPLVVGLARRGDLVLTVGAGDVTMIGPEILRGLADIANPAHPADPADPAHPSQDADKESR
ncbi:MAG: UDP-N-acetylmuramate--L-alanine ligase [Lapillicoccus sp.]